MTTETPYLIDAEMMGPDFSGTAGDLGPFVAVLAEQCNRPVDSFRVAQHISQPVGVAEPAEHDWLSAVQAFAEAHPHLWTDKRTVVDAAAIRRPRTIHGLTDPTIIRHLAPGGESYDHEVSVEDFDEDDNAGPGHHYGVEVSARVGECWDAGLVACKDRNVSPRSREGIALRYHAMHGAVRLPGELHRWLAGQAEQEARRATQLAQKAAALADYEEVLDDYTDVGADEYSGRWWSRADREELPLLGRHDTEEITGGWRAARRLPNGDIVTYSRDAWSRWTRDPALIADHASRGEIWGHHYAPDLLDLLGELEQRRALRLSCYSWFGGTLRADGNIVRAYGRGQTGSEKLERLREHLQACIELHPEHRAELDRALGLAVDGSVTEQRS